MGRRAEPGDRGPPARHARAPVRIEKALAALAMGLVCLISFANVVVRYATNISFAFTEEFSVFLLVFMTFVGAAAAFAVDGHIRITFFVDRMPPVWRWLCELVSAVATTLLFTLIIYYGAQVTYDEWYWGETSPGLGYPAWIYSIWLPLLSIVIVLRVLRHAWAYLRQGLRAGAGGG